eukprot:CAMPEP_0117652568 /NCGR_PEP_ID=MMETSP0804-20121206/2697_1 /TAXON_ID=1074897 /ORGANISM="Tetraselmis astigmatica, Strain CCMP880" /LENGTH=407 /DNA_ID=CAMNT_0005458625 /DNA_START=241 /DNA_END=1464 /DNA_ORIENTATION=+
MVGAHPRTSRKQGHGERQIEGKQMPPLVDWGGPDTARSLCVPHPEGGSCTLSHSHLSFLLSALRSAESPPAYKQFVIHELQCRQRSEGTCLYEARMAFSSREQAIQAKLARETPAPPPPATWWAPAPGNGGRREEEDNDEEEDPYTRHAQSVEVEKCTWDTNRGCVAMAAHVSFESMVNVCKVEKAGHMAGTAEWVSLDMWPVVVQAMEAECQRHNHTWVTCQSSLAGACQWIGPSRLPARSPTPPPAPSSLGEDYDEPGRCTLNASQPMQELQARLDCRGTKPMVDAFINYNVLFDLCGTAINPQMCSTLAQSEPCMWSANRLTCFPSVGVLLEPMGPEGRRLSAELRTCEATELTAGGRCVQHDGSGSRALQPAGAQRHENPVLILAIILSLLLFGLVVLRGRTT